MQRTPYATLARLAGKGPRALHAALQLSEAHTSRLLAGAREPTAAQANQLDTLLALGEPVPGEEVPRFALTWHSAAGLTLLLGSDRIWTYNSRNLAETALSVLSSDMDAMFVVVPCWRAWVIEQALIRRGSKPKYVDIDESDPAPNKATKIAQHIVDVYPDAQRLSASAHSASESHED